MGIRATSNGLARLLGHLFTDGPQDFGSAAGLELVRPAATKDLVKDHSQRIDVAGSRDRFSLYLLGARIFEIFAYGIRVRSHLLSALDRNSLAMPKPISFGTPRSVIRYFSASSHRGLRHADEQRELLRRLGQKA